MAFTSDKDNVAAEVTRRVVAAEVTRRSSAGTIVNVPQPMNGIAQRWNDAKASWTALDCGSPLPLFMRKSASRRRAEATLWRAAKAEGLAAAQSPRSCVVSLEAGKRYYIEVVQRRGTGLSHLSVRRRLPDGTEERPVPAFRLRVR